jgi:hypothetical protein
MLGMGMLCWDILAVMVAMVGIIDRPHITSPGIVHLRWFIDPHRHVIVLRHNLVLLSVGTLTRRVVRATQVAG